MKYQPEHLQRSRQPLILFHVMPSGVYTAYMRDIPNFEKKKCRRAIRTSFIFHLSSKHQIQDAFWEKNVHNSVRMANRTRRQTATPCIALKPTNFLSALSQSSQHPNQRIGSPACWACTILSVSVFRFEHFIVTKKKKNRSNRDRCGLMRRASRGLSSLSSFTVTVCRSLC